MPDLEAEVLRLRDRVHALANRLALTRWEGRATRTELQELAGDVEKLAGLLRALVARVDGMTHAEEVADKVTAALDERRRARWTFLRKTAAATAGLILCVPALHELVAILTSL